MTTDLHREYRHNRGGIANDLATATVSGSTFIGNSATDGGGLESLSTGPQPTTTTATVRDSTFIGNSASHDGGGIYNAVPQSSTDEVTATVGRTFIGNTATDGGGIFNAVTSVNPRNHTINVTLAVVAVSDTAFIGNSASNDGGGIENDGTATVNDCTFDPTPPATTEAASSTPSQ